MRNGIKALLGKTLVAIEGGIGDNEIQFVTDAGERYCMYHFLRLLQVDIRVEDITGDLQDLIGSPILLAEESTGYLYSDAGPYWSGTWTLYKLATIKGCVDIRWLDESNGYYSERVDFSPSPR
jgi:hypothetical protein